MGWDRKPSTFGLSIKGRSERVQRRMAIDLHKNIVDETPVETGRAKTNWQSSVTATNNRQLDELDVGQKGSEARAAANAQQAIDLATATFSKAPQRKPWYIFNNLEYIGLLEDGSSKQAPAGMVERSIRRIVRRYG